ncbi:MAG TPA: 50S ribosomal protein L11 methyltransferase [Xanthobacteraceae bacterium]|nr:50S ribosomal protein L11 methyltransferase [Xanthobacteraceae bacterium]
MPDEAHGSQTADALAPWLRRMVEFVESETRPTSPAYVAEITLRLAPDPVPLWERIERGAGLNGGPPFWALAWPGGLALARHLFDHPGLVCGRRVLDLAAGSGLLAIAAAKCGARQAIANDIDPLAAVAITLNAEANGAAVAVRADDLLTEESAFDPSTVDVVLAGDAFYDHALAPRALAFLARCHAAGCRVLIGDPGRADLPAERLTRLGSHAVPVARGCQYVTAARETVREDAGEEFQAAAVWAFAS